MVFKACGSFAKALHLHQRIGFNVWSPPAEKYEGMLLYCINTVTDLFGSHGVHRFSAQWPNHPESLIAYIAHA